MTPKFYRLLIRPDHTTICPWCAVVNRQVTGNDCGHVAKITAKRVMFYYWGIRPILDANQSAALR